MFEFLNEIYVEEADCDIIKEVSSQKMENVATNETSSLLDDITSLEELDAIEYLSAEGLLIADSGH